MRMPVQNPSRGICNRKRNRAGRRAAGRSEGVLRAQERARQITISDHRPAVNRVESIPRSERLEMLIRESPSCGSGGVYIPPYD
jgi:hypothetical protein